MASQIPKIAKITLKTARAMDRLSPFKIRAKHLKPGARISVLHVPLAHQTQVAFLNLRIEYLGGDAGHQLLELEPETTIGDVLKYIFIK